MIKWLIFLLTTICLFGACHVNERQYREKEPAKLVVKKNSYCSKGIFCVRAEFWLNDIALADNQAVTLMDKEIGKTFYMVTKQDTSYPVSAERINYGIANEVVYLLSFIDSITVGQGVKKIEYNGKFYGIKRQEFMIH